MDIPRQYELVYILPGETGEQEVNDLRAQIQQIVDRFGATIDAHENWGKKKLAYEIGPHKDGLYLLELITGPAALIKELDRRLKVLDIVVRHLVVRVDEEMRVAARRKAEREAHQAKRRAARGLPPKDDAPASGDEAVTSDAGEPAAATEAEA
ncbi:MAG: 30S ribosomal protein S6 [Vicinamibacteraceae bacterium]|nr:30S ribosomal protein S6 [Vicinamibacteraceae bacterium]